MSILFAELDIEVVKLTLLPKSGGDPVTYYLAHDYWPAGTIYPSSPACYPLLAGSPPVRRGVGVGANGVAGIKFDVGITLFADTHLSEHGKTFQDLLDVYEIHNARAEVRYYAKPVDEVGEFGAATGEELASIPLWGGIYAALPSPDGSTGPGDLAHLAFTYRGFWDVTGGSAEALTTHTDSINIRQTLTVIDTATDAGNGTMTLRCRDVWTKNKEISKRLDSTVLTGLDENWKGEYGAIVFGQSTIAGDGIPIDAPFFDSKINTSTYHPEAKLFGGWGFHNFHGNHALWRVLVKNQFTDFNKDTWVEVDLQDPDGQTSGDGESVATPVADPPNWPRDLTRYERAIVTTPAADAARILTAVRTYVKVNTLDRCADITEGQYFYCKKNPDIFSQGDDLSLELWVKFDSLHHASNKRIICQQGNQRKKGRLEWMLYFDTSDDKPKFGISSNGTSVAVAATWSANLTTGVWYQICCRHDESANTVAINVNAGTTVTASTGTTEMDNRDGFFTIGSRNPSDASFDGQIKVFRYWSRVLTDGDVLGLYNGGVPKLTDDLSDQETYNLTASVDFNDPFGVREGSRGSLDLYSDATSNAVPRDIPYAYASCAALTPGNKYGEISINVGPGESMESGSNYNVKAIHRKSTIDVTTPALTSGAAATYFTIDPPLVMAPGVDYMTILKMANANTNSYFALCSYDSHAGSSHYAIDKRVKRDKDQPEPNWTKQNDVRLDMQLYYLGKGPDDYNQGGTVDGHRYTYQHLDAKAITLSTGQSNLEFNNNLTFKLCVTGLNDDNVGTYTGVPGFFGIIEKPTEIIHFTLMDSDFGLGMSSTEVDVGSFATARTVIENAYENGLKMQIVINREIDAETFILEVCRQSRMIFYKTRDGKLALKAPIMNSSFAATFSEVRHRADFDMVAVADNDYGQILNEFHNFYRVVGEPARRCGERP